MPTSLLPIPEALNVKPDSPPTENSPHIVTHHLFSSEYSKTDDQPQAPPSLPMAIIRKVSTILACADKETTNTLFLVCRATNDWVLPILYHSIRFTTTAKVDMFIKVHARRIDRLASRLLLVRNLYFGRTPADHGDLTYTSNWPVATIVRILWMCRFIEAITILYLDMDKWHKFEHALPPTLQTLVMGPIHGTFSSDAMALHPRISYFTSCHTPLSHDEFIDIITYPTMRKMRNVVAGDTMGPMWVLDQLRALKESKTLETLEIMVVGPVIHSDPLYRILQKEIPQVTDDERVSLVHVVTHDWVSVIYTEFHDRKLQYVYKIAELCDCHSETVQGEIKYDHKNACTLP